MTKRTIKVQSINYSYIKCPTCKTIGEYTQHNEDKICTECGTIIETPYPYVAGIRIHTLQSPNFTKKTKRRKNNEPK